MGAAAPAVDLAKPPPQQGRVGAAAVREPLDLAGDRGQACLTRVTTVLPLAVRVVVVTVTPEAVVVATEWVTRGPAAAGVPTADAAAGGAAVAGGAAAWDAWWARATAAVPVPAIRTAAVQLDIRRTCWRLSRRAVARFDGSMSCPFMLCLSSTGCATGHELTVRDR